MEDVVCFRFEGYVADYSLSARHRPVVDGKFTFKLLFDELVKSQLMARSSLLLSRALVLDLFLRILLFLFPQSYVL